MTDYELPRTEDGEPDFDMIADWLTSNVVVGDPALLLAAIYYAGKEKARKEEREACAKKCDFVAETIPKTIAGRQAKKLAEAIRERGDK